MAMGSATGSTFTTRGFSYSAIEDVSSQEAKGIEITEKK
jgi:hypothetical protein